MFGDKGTTLLCFHKNAKEEYLIRPFMRLQQPRTLLKKLLIDLSLIAIIAPLRENSSIYPDFF